MIAVLRRHSFASVVALIGLVSAARLVFLFFYQTALGPDEAQYWFWSRELDWGYYSKPPMIAWVIASTTALFGNVEWAVRLWSPILIGGSSLFVFLTGRALFGGVAGAWAGLLWLFLPVVTLGGTIISTDVPLLFFWTMGLWALVRLCLASPRRGYFSALGLGTAIGLGLLSKYAMIYFPLGWGLALLASSTARASLRRETLIVPVVAGAIFAPNVIWNVANGLQTVGHTADNADWRGELNFDQLWSFVGDQFGVFGPVLMLAFIYGVLRLRRLAVLGGPAFERDRLLLSFALPPLVLICTQAVLSRAHANWAVTAYPAATLLVTAWMGRLGSTWLLKLSAALQVFVFALVTAGLLYFPLADSVGLSKAVKRLRGWDIQTEELAARARGYDAVVVDERELAAHLVWEWRDTDIALAVEDTNGRLDNTFEYAFPFEPERGGRYLLVRPFRSGLCWFQGYGLEELAPSFVDLHDTRRGRPERTLDLYEFTAWEGRVATVC